MRKNIIAIIATFFILALSSNAYAYSNPLPNNILQVGIRHAGFGMTESFNMLSDHGFEIGIYDINNNFIVEYVFDSHYITAARDLSYRISGSTVNYTTDSANVKPYHLQVDTTFANFAQADSFIDTVRASGYNGTIFPARIGDNYVVRIDDFSSLENAQAKAAEYMGYTGGISLTAVGLEWRTVTFIDMNTNEILLEYDPQGQFPAIRPLTNSITMMLQSKDRLSGVVDDRPPGTGYPTTATPDKEEPTPIVPSVPDQEEVDTTPESPTDTTPQIPDSTVMGDGSYDVPNLTLTKNGSYYYSGGFEFRRVGDTQLEVVNMVDLEDYLLGVVPFEMSNSWPVEALKAQTLTARTYALTNLSRHAGENFHICNTVHCQAYYGNSRVNDAVIEAVYSTAGQIVTYDNKPIATYYYSSSGGYTETNANAWGGSPLPYYAAVPDLFEPQDKITHFSNYYTLDDLTEVVRDLGQGHIGNVIDVYVSEYTDPAENVYSVTFVGDTGQTYTVSRTDNVRIKLSELVKSPNFDIFVVPLLLVNDYKTTLDLPVSEMFAMTGEGTVASVTTKASDLAILTADNTVTIDTSDLTYNFKGSGWGHNVGMSQWGAYGMAEMGLKYDQIIKYYYAGVEISQLS